MKNLASLLALVFVLAWHTPSAFGLGASFPPGAEITQQREWPEGLADILNKSDRVGGFFVNANDYFYFSGDSEAFNAFLEEMSKLKDAPLTVVLLEGRQRATAPWDRDAAAQPEADWMTCVLRRGWSYDEPLDPAAPKDKPGFALIVNAWLGGQIHEDRLRIPVDVKTVFASKIKLSIRCPADNLKVGDRIPVDFTVANEGKSELDYLEYPDLAENANGFRLEAKGEEGTALASPDIDMHGDAPGRWMKLPPAKSFTKTLVLNRFALLHAPGRLVVTGSYRLRGQFAVVTSNPVTVTVQPRTPAEMTAYVDGLIARLNALKGEQGRDDLMRQLTYTGDSRILPALIDSMYKTKTPFCRELAFNAYLPDKAEIKQQVLAAATKSGLTPGMSSFLWCSNITAVEMYPLIDRSLANDNPGCWEPGCRAAQTFREKRFVPRLIAIAGAPGTNANEQAMWALVRNRTDEGIAALRRILSGPDERLKKLAADVIRTAYRQPGEENLFLKPGDFPQEYQKEK